MSQSVFSYTIGPPDHECTLMSVLVVTYVQGLRNAAYDLLFGNLEYAIERRRNSSASPFLPASPASISTVPSSAFTRSPYVPVCGLAGSVGSGLHYAVARSEHQPTRAQCAVRVLSRLSELCN